MVKQRLDLSQRHVGHFVQVRVIGARTRTVGRGALIKRLARRFLAECLNRLHHQRRLRKRSKPLRQQGRNGVIGFLRFGQIQRATLGGFGCVKFRFRAHVVEIGLKVALHPHLLLDDAHFLMDPRDLREAQLVDLFRRHVGCGVIGQTLGIIAGAIPEAPHAVVGSGDFFLRRHFGYQRLIGWLHCAVERLRRVGNQKIFFDLANVELADLPLEIGKQRRIGATVKRRASDDVARVVDDIGVDPFGRHDALRGASLGLLNGLAHPRANAEQAAHIGAGVGLIVNAVDVNQEGRQFALRTVHLVKDIAIVVILNGRLTALGPLFKQAIGQPVFRRQLCGVKACAHFLERRARGVIGARLGCGGEIVPPAIVAVFYAPIGFAQRR